MTAKERMVEIWNAHDLSHEAGKAIEAAIEAAVKEERAACAELADSKFSGYAYSREADFELAGTQIADEIRKRGQ